MLLFADSVYLLIHQVNKSDSATMKRSGNSMDNPLFDRSRLLLGDHVLQQFQDTKVILFGVGGVGSWCAEALIRSGIGHLTIVDSDVVCATNVNRQLQATSLTVGDVKVDVLKKHLLEINPDADVKALCKVYNRDSRPEFDLSSFDYVIDAIDSLSCKIELIAHALVSDTKLFSAMGAACKIDPSRVRVSSIWKTDVCRLARLVRKRLRHRRVYDDFLCVWSDEVMPPLPPGAVGDDCEDTAVEISNESDNDSKLPEKAVINGSMVHITGVFGFMLAGLVFQDIQASLSTQA